MNAPRDVEPIAPFPRLRAGKACPARSGGQLPPPLAGEGWGGGGNEAADLCAASREAARSMIH